MGIGDRITEVRKRNGLSQAELAKRSGISQAGISYIENGPVSNCPKIQRAFFKKQKLYYHSLRLTKKQLYLSPIGDIVSVKGDAPP